MSVKRAQFSHVACQVGGSLPCPSPRQLRHWPVVHLEFLMIYRTFIKEPLNSLTYIQQSFD